MKNLQTILNTFKKYNTLNNEKFTNLNLDTISETMFEGENFKCFYTIQTSTHTSPSFTALLTVQYKGVNVEQYGSSTEEENKFIISFFKNQYATAWRGRSVREEEAKAEFNNLIK
tara:strand:+ start:206 stop:550 length:345 start_codon:yes stop_codon:yes gene_type:complete